MHFQGSLSADDLFEVQSLGENFNYAFALCTLNYEL